jgi:hypothetical protein
LSTAFNKFIYCLERHGCEPRKNGSRYKARCVANEDDNPSPSALAGNVGRVLVCCHAQCDTSSIVDALGLKMTDLFPPDSASKRRASAGPSYSLRGGGRVIRAGAYGPKAACQKRDISFDVPERLPTSGGGAR